MFETFVFLWFAFGFSCDVTGVDLKLVLEIGEVDDAGHVLGEYVENLEGLF